MNQTASATMLAGLVVALGLALARPLPLLGDSWLSPRPDPLKATTSRAARESAVQTIPLAKLDSEARAKVSSVLSKVTFFRRMPTRVIQCDPDLYLFLVQHPDVVVNIWQLMGVSEMAVEQAGPTTFRVTDPAGTTGSIEYLYRSHDTHVIYSEGSYDGPLFTRPVQGRGLMILKTGYVRETDGRYYITCRLDSFMNVDHLGVELLTKAFQPLVGKVADNNFTQTAGFLGSLSRTAERNHQGVQRLAKKLSKVQPDVREQFALLAEQVAEKASQLNDRNASRPAAVAERPGKRAGQ